MIIVLAYMSFLTVRKIACECGGFNMHAYQFGDAFAFQIESLCKGTDNETEYKGKGTGISQSPASWSGQYHPCFLHCHDMNGCGVDLFSPLRLLFRFLFIEFPGPAGFVGQAG
jgi:hypothetical protein